MRSRRDWNHGVLQTREDLVPYLQLDTPDRYPAEQKQRLAKRLGEIYSQTMSSNINRLTVAIRELGAEVSGVVANENPDRPLF